MNNLLNRLVLVFLCMLGVIFFVYQIYQELYQPYQTETVSVSSYTDEVSLEGVVLKDETVIESSYDGVVRYEYENAQKVLSGASVATVYANQSDLLASNQIETLTRRVELLTSVSGKSAASSVTATNSVSTVQRGQINLLYDVLSGDYSALSDRSDTLLKGLLQQKLLLDSSLSFSDAIANLNSQIASLQSSMNGSSVTVAAPASGYFTNETDGYETLLGTSHINAVTVDAVTQLQNTQPAQTGQSAVGKLMTGAKWYYLAKLKSSDAIRFAEGDTVQLVFHDNTSQSVSATVEKVNVDASAEQSAVLLSTSEVNGDLINLRMETAYSVFETGSGLKVPREAIRIVDGQVGVYISRNRVVKFKKLDVLYEGSDYVISELHTDSASSDYLSLYDEIILNGNDVYDGKVL